MLKTCKPKRTVWRTGLSVLVLLLLASACGGAEQAAPDTQDQPTDPAGAGDAGDDASDQEIEDDTTSWEPTEGVTLIVHTAAGGGADQFARAMAAFFEAQRPELTITVENRQGGGGITAYSHAFQQRADPHVLLGMDVGMLTLPMTQETPYDWREFTPIGHGEELVSVATVAAGTFTDLTDVAERSRGELVRAGLAGLAGPLALTLTLFESEADGDFERVVLDSGAEIVTAVRAGNVELGMPAPLHVIDYLEQGEVEALAVFANDRLDVGPLADVPTAAELGYDIVTPGFRGLVGPPEMPDEARTYWVNLFESWVASDDYREYIDNVLALPSNSSGEDFAAYMDEMEERVRPAAEQLAQN